MTPPNALIYFLIFNNLAPAKIPEPSAHAIEPAHFVICHADGSATTGKVVFLLKLMVCTNLFSSFILYFVETLWPFASYAQGLSIIPVIIFWLLTIKISPVEYSLPKYSASVTSLDPSSKSKEKV